VAISKQVFIKPYSQEFRGEALAACDRGRSTREVATFRRVARTSTRLNSVFSKYKWLLKGASARTVEALWSVCGDVLDRFTETQCRNCIQHCGYRYM
jgi:hypothetical protein